MELQFSQIKLAPTDFKGKVVLESLHEDITVAELAKKYGAHAAARNKHAFSYRWVCT